uniref:Acetyltransferase n=1 Tax=Jahnella sp. MSr9139 TaxID=1434086 RepID=A0A3Q8IBX7_9BACT|nr:acetyltransferase [Jahnella sp. MSr9139]
MAVIRLAVPADAAALAGLAERTFRDTFAADNTPEDMAEHVAQAYSPARQARELSDPEITTLVAEAPAGELMAYAQLRGGAAPASVTGPAPVEIWRFYVDRPYHGQGLAKQLMAAVLEAAARRGAATLWLGVWERNPRAQAFYRKCGFVDVGAHIFVLGSDRQTDILMARPLAGAGAAGDEGERENRKGTGAQEGEK